MGDRNLRRMTRKGSKVGPDLVGMIVSSAGTPISEEHIRIHNAWLDLGLREYGGSGPELICAPVSSAGSPIPEEHVPIHRAWHDLAVREHRRRREG